MIVAGDEAKKYDAVRLDSYNTVNDPGTLIFADDALGVVKWVDRVGQT